MDEATTKAWRISARDRRQLGPNWSYQASDGSTCKLYSFLYAFEYGISSRNIQTTERFMHLKRFRGSGGL